MINFCHPAPIQGLEQVMVEPAARDSFINTIEEGLKGRYLAAITVLYISGIACGRICLEKPAAIYLAVVFLSLIHISEPTRPY